MTMDGLVAKCDGSKYTLVVLTAKVARELVEQGWPDDGRKCHKMVLSAMEKIDRDEIGFQRVKVGLK